MGSGLSTDYIPLQSIVTDILSENEVLVHVFVEAMDLSRHVLKIFISVRPRSRQTKLYCDCNRYRTRTMRQISGIIRAALLSVRMGSGSSLCFVARCITWLSLQAIDFQKEAPYGHQDSLLTVPCQCKKVTHFLKSRWQKVVHWLAG